MLAANEPPCSQTPLTTPGSSGLEHVAVDEVEVLAFSRARVQTVILRDLDFVPPDVGDSGLTVPVHPANGAWNVVEPVVVSVLGASRSEKLHPQTQTEKRLSELADVPLECSDPALLAKVPNPVSKRADARQYDPAGDVEVAGVIADPRPSAYCIERIRHRTEVSHRVVDDDDVHTLSSAVERSKSRKRRRQAPG